MVGIFSISVFMAMYILQRAAKRHYKEGTRYNFRLGSLFHNPNRLVVGLFFTLYSITVYYGFRTVPASVALPVYMTAPVLLLLFSNRINGSPINAGQLVSVLVCFLGVILVAHSHPVKDVQYIRGVLALVLSAMGYALTYVMMQYQPGRSFLKNAVTAAHLSERDGTLWEKMHMQLYNTNTLPLLVAILYIVLKRPTAPSIGTVAILFPIYVITGYLSQLCYLYAYNHLPISTYGALENTAVIAGLIIGAFVLGEKITPQRLFGAALIVGGIVGETRMRDKINGV